MRIYPKISYDEKDDFKAGVTAPAWDSLKKQWSCEADEKSLRWLAYSALNEDTRVKAAEEYEKLKDPVECEKRRAEEETAKKSEWLNTLDSSWLETYTPVKKLFKHQEEAISRIVKSKIQGLFLEMGTGKTAIAVVAFDALKKMKKAKRALIVCGKSIIGVWEKEFSEWTSLNVKVAVGSARDRADVINYSTSADVIVTNYETFNAVKNIPMDWEQFDFIALDESQAIKSPDAARTCHILKEFQDVDCYKLILSGTPITKTPLDVYSQIEFLKSGYLGFKNIFSFRRRYCEMGGYKDRQIVGVKNIAELKAKLEKVSISMRKDELIDLPDKMYVRREITMYDDMAKAYDDMEYELETEFADGETLTAATELSKMIRLKQVLAGDRFKTHAKGDTLKEILEEQLERGEKTVVFAHLMTSIQEIRKVCEELDIEYSIITGEVKDRTEQIERFQSGSAQVFIGGVQAASEGITLTAASTMIYYDNSFGMRERTQSEDRIHRIGQSHKCLYIDLVYVGTIDETVLDALMRKEDVATSVIDSFKKGRLSKLVGA